MTTGTLLSRLWSWLVAIACTVTLALAKSAFDFRLDSFALLLSASTTDVT